MAWPRASAAPYRLAPLQATLAACDHSCMALGCSRSPLQGPGHNWSPLPAVRKGGASHGQALCKGDGPPVGVVNYNQGPCRGSAHGQPARRRLVGSTHPQGRRPRTQRK
ncbi:hypothetical protein GW17_00050816 [Ensete ventricosum]|nr:hypothetical protein GW17_00050816 [Ensete ventricosum]